MGSFYMTPTTVLLWDIIAVAWLSLIGLVGWNWIVTYRSWNRETSWQRLLIGSLVQGVFAAQIVWAFAVMSLNQVLPAELPTWLENTAHILFILAAGPLAVGALAFPGGSLFNPLLGVPPYTVLYLAFNAIAVVWRRVRENVFHLR